MKTITSKDNHIYKNALRLTKKKYRDETGMYLLEGVKPLEDALDMGISVETIFIREKPEDERPVPDGAPAVMLAGKLFARLSQTESSQGVISVVRKREYGEDDFIAAVGNGNIVVMDRLQDPGNIGTIIRTAEAAGYGGIVMVSGSGDVYSPKVVRAAAGSLFRMPVIYAGSAEEAADFVKKMDKRLTVTCLDASRDCFQEDLTCETALVIGNEGSGVSDVLLERADVRVRIPMEGSIESLNAAVAAGILMYQSRKKINADER